MPTERQIEANKVNAQKSTGPRTDEGKAKSSPNRLSHGFASCALRHQALLFADPEAPDARNVTPKDFALLIRYHTSAENAFHKAYNQIVKAQKERKKSEIGFEPQNAGQTADPPPDPPKTGPKTAPIACVHTDFPAEPATAAMDITPEAPKILKKAA